MKQGRCPYIVTYCLEKFEDMPNGGFYSQSGHYADRE